MKKKKTVTPILFVLLIAAGLAAGAVAALAANAGLLPWVQAAGGSAAGNGKGADGDSSKESAYKADGTILYEGVKYTARSKEIAEEYVGEQLISLSVEGMDGEEEGLNGEETSDGEEQEAESTGISLYKIENISVICAVAVQYEGTDSWHPAVNTGYCPETLGQFVEDLDLTNTLPIDMIGYEEETDTGSWSYFGPADDDAVEKMMEVLTSRPKAENEPGLEHEPTAAYAQVLTSLPLLGYEDENARGYVEIEVYEDGYLMISFEALGEQYFNIGKSAAKKFIQYVEQLAEEAESG